MKIIKIIAVLLVLIITIGTFAGCDGHQKAEPTSVAIAMGKRKNTAEPAFASSKLNQDILTAATTDGSHISIVETDGKGFIVASVPINIKAGSSKAIQTKDANNLITALGSYIASTFPKTPEADVLKGISLTVRELASSGEAGRKVLYILDGGLQTTGAFDMTKRNIIDGFTDELVENAATQLPDMGFIDEVLWIGLGDFAENQEDANGETKSKLKSFWSSILASAGAKNVKFLEDNTVKKDSPEDWPDVSVVRFTRDIITDDELNLNGIRLDEEKVSFVPNSSEFLDKTQAIDAVSEIANVLKTDSSKSIFLVGSTATFGSEDGCMDLSRNRAQAVKELLIESGVQEDQVTSFGIGQEPTSFKVKDIDPETGGLVEDLASNNRAVFIFENSSENKDIQELYRRFA